MRKACCDGSSRKLREWKPDHSFGGLCRSYVKINQGAAFWSELASRQRFETRNKGISVFAAVGQLVFQERRRLFFVTVLAFLAGCLFYARLASSLNAPQIALFTGFVYAVVIAPVTLVICAFAPGFRFMIEAIALSRLIVALVAFLAPEVGHVLITTPMLTAILVVSGGGLLSPLVHGRIVRDKSRAWHERYGIRAALARHPVKVDGTLRQHRFTGWIDDAIPVPA